MEKKTGLQRITLHIIGTLCAMMGIFTPGWYQQETREKGGRKLLISVHKGLWYYKNCTGNLGCSIHSFYQNYRETLKRDPTSDIGVTYAAQLGHAMVALIALILSIVCIVTMGMTFRQSYRHTQMKLTLLSSLISITSSTMLLVEIGFYSADSAARTRYYKEKDYENVFFPYSIFLTAVGCALHISVAYMNLKTIWRKLINLSFDSSHKIETYVQNSQPELSGRKEKRTETVVNEFTTSDVVLF